MSKTKIDYELDIQREQRTIDYYSQLLEKQPSNYNAFKMRKASVASLNRYKKIYSTMAN